LQRQNQIQKDKIMPNPIYVDFVNGVDSANGSTFALRVKTLGRADALSAPGDTVRIMGNRPSNSLVNATWTNGSALVTLASPLTKSLYTDGAWTSASGNLTASTSASPSTPLQRQGANCAKFVSSGFTTGKAAHWPLGSVQDLSGYQQLSFWVCCTSTLAANRLRLDLCSDTAGNTIVNSFTVNVALTANKWAVVTIDLGTPMSDSIQSLRLTSLATINGKTILLDNIVACKKPSAPDCLTLSSLISPDASVWYHVQSIDGTTVYVDGADTSILAGSARGFQGDTVTATLQLLQPTVSGIGDGTWAQTFADVGTAGNPITISGGWDAADMATQTGLTVIDRMDGGSSAIRLIGNTGYVFVDGFAFVRCLDATTVDATANQMGATNCTFLGVANLPDYLLGMTYANCNIINCGDNILIAAQGDKWVVDSTRVWGTVSVPGFSVTSPGARIANSEAVGGGSHGFDIAAKCKEFRNNSARKNTGRGFSMTDLGGVLAFDLKAVGNTVAEVYLAAAANNEINGLDTNTPGGSSVPQVLSLAVEPVLIQNWQPYTGVSPAAVMFTLGSPGSGRTAGRALVSKQHLADPNKNNIYSEYGLVTTDGADSYNGSGLGWKFQPNANAFATSPLRLLISRVPCAANVQTTLTFYAKLSASGVNARFRIVGGRYAGVGSVGSDVVTNVTATTWTAHNLVFTPTEACVVEIFFETWGSTSVFATVSGPLTLAQSVLSATYVLAPGSKSEPTLRGALQPTSVLAYVAQATPFFVSDPSTSYEYDKLGRLVKTGRETT
jgi:hypothetical protein